jgi:ribonuclease D
VATLTTQPIERGRSWGDVSIDVAKQAREKDICLEEVAKWREAELAARTNGAPGA